ncbi:hypothetical protein Dimus_028833, partial [Dionaea muscipula]
VLALVGDQLDYGDDVCGAVLSIRFSEDILSERKLQRKLRTEESVNVKQQQPIAVKERSRKKKTGGGPTFTSLLTARSKETTAISGVARKREDLIIVNIDEASGDDELAVAKYAEDIYKFYKLTEFQLSRGRVRFVITWASSLI